MLNVGPFEMGRKFSISLDDIPDVPDICPIAKIPIFIRPYTGKTGPCLNSPTLDRVDNSKGYVAGNLRVISHKGNKWKSDMSINDIICLLDYMRS